MCWGCMWRIIGSRSDDDHWRSRCKPWILWPTPYTYIYRMIGFIGASLQLQSITIFVRGGNGTPIPPRQFPLPTELFRRLPLIWIILYYIISMHIYVLSELESTFLSHSICSRVKCICWKSNCNIKDKRFILRVYVVWERETNANLFICLLNNIKFITIETLSFSCKHVQRSK
jgi:hypothetical protein